MFFVLKTKRPAFPLAFEQKKIKNTYLKKFSPYFTLTL